MVKRHAAGGATGGSSPLRGSFHLGPPPPEEGEERRGFSLTIVESAGEGDLDGAAGINWEWSGEWGARTASIAVVATTLTELWAATWATIGGDSGGALPPRAVLYSRCTRARCERAAVGTQL